MLAEIIIRNFAIIDEVTVRLAPRLNVLTGETGAGKSIIVDALAAVLGERTSPDVVRGGESAAQIEAHFHLSPVLAARLDPLLEEQGLAGEDPRYLVLSREIRAEGRSLARVNGRLVAAAVVRQLGEMLVDIHGQTEHLSLLRVPEHLHFLDRFARLDEMRAEMARRAADVSRLRAEIAAIEENSLARERRLERLRYEVEEIESARLTEGEEESLRGERTRLANSEKLSALAGSAYEALYGGSGDTPSGADLVGQAVSWLIELERTDPDLGPLRERAETLADGLEDIARELRHYRDAVEYNPSRLDQVEERLALISNLKRKYGAGIPEILAYGQRAGAELDQLGGGEERLQELRQILAQAKDAASAVAAELSERRREAADRLASAVEGQLADLAMERARFAVGIEQVADEDGLVVNGRGLAFDRTGVDRVEFLLAPNPGEPMRPLARIASGGENSRLMLALKTVLSEADDAGTLIFDEVDTGIGGRLGHIVGEKLAGLATTHQVLCVTHLPQLAAFADVHLSVGKEIIGDRTRTAVTVLDRERRLAELAAMQGAVSPATLRSAEEMLERGRAER